MGCADNKESPPAMAAAKRMPPVQALQISDISKKPLSGKGKPHRDNFLTMNIAKQAKASELERPGR
jgi:hypothetical protein